MVSFLHIRASKFFSAKLLAIQWYPEPVLLHRVIPIQLWDYGFLFAELEEVLTDSLRDTTSSYMQLGFIVLITTFSAQ